MSTERCPPGQAAQPLGAQGPGPPASVLCQAGVGECRAGGHSAARAQDPQWRPGCWGEPGPQPPSAQSTHRPPCRAPKDAAASGNTGEKTLYVMVSSGNHVNGQWPPGTTRRCQTPRLPWCRADGTRLPSSWCPWESACRISQPPKGACQLWDRSPAPVSLVPHRLSHSMLVLTPEPAPVQ